MEPIMVGESPPKRHFLPRDFKIEKWGEIKVFFDQLLERPINSVQDLEEWLQHKSEFFAIISEEFGWRFIRMSVDTLSKERLAVFQDFLKNIAPKIQPLAYKLDLKLLASPYLDGLDQEKYHIFLRTVKNNVELFCEKNIPLNTNIQLKSKEFGSIQAKMTVNINGEDLTMQQAKVLTESKDRSLRKEVFQKTVERRLQDTAAIDRLFDELFEMRHETALNAGYENFRDFQFAKLGRFDYSPEDCSLFHDSVAKEIMPLINKGLERRKKILGLDVLKPWDLNVDISGKSLKPFDGEENLVNLSIETLERLNPYFGECLKTMKRMQRFDLDSRKGKRPGGYNSDLPESGVPFIFMNAANSFKDMRIMMHESGHAVHSFLRGHLELTEFKKVTSEVAELAAMAMEMLSMDYWDTFFPDPDDLKRAKLLQIERTLDVLPWIATVDKFQHWIYTNPKHSVAERDAAWRRIQAEFTSPLIDWTGFEDFQTKYWHRQLHIFEMPFYYIEYGIAQLGAWSVWKNYCENPKKAVEDYMNALGLGYTKTIGELYEAANIKFDFSPKHISKLVAFVRGKIVEMES